MRADAQPCAERRRLADVVALAVQRTHETKERFDLDRATRRNDVQLIVQLVDARTAERLAERAFREHVEQHDCTE